MRKLGQHFLKNKKVAAAIADAVAPRTGDDVIEIGPGHGELTALLAERCNAVDAPLTVIERDPRLIEGLRSRFSNASDKKDGPDASDVAVSVIEGDALTVLPTLMEERRNAKFLLAGNLPYYITGYLLRIIGEMPSPPERCVFMVQREVAERIIAAPPHMNRLAASVQFWATPSIILGVPRADFSPPPKVESAVLLLTAHPPKSKKENGAASKDAYYRAVRALFAQPRKTIINNIAASLPPTTKEALSERLASLTLAPNARPQDLSIEGIAALAKTFFS